MQSHNFHNMVERPIITYYYMPINMATKAAKYIARDLVVYLLLILMCNGRLEAQLPQPKVHVQRAGGVGGSCSRTGVLYF